MTLPVLKSAATDELLKQIDPELIENGCLHVLAFDAIRERSGRRWESRQDTVWEMAEREFERDFTSADHLIRIDDVNFLLLQPQQTRHGARGAALKLLRDILTFFLGSAARTDVKLSQVTGFGPNGFEHGPVNISDAEFAALSTPIPMGAPPAPPVMTETVGTAALVEGRTFEPPEETKREALPRFVEGSRPYETLFVLQPLWDVRNRAVASHRIKPLVFQRNGDQGVEMADLRRATLRDLIRLDLIVLTEAKRLIAEEAKSRRFALHVPVHYATLSSSTGRNAVLWALKQIPQAASSVVICLDGLEPGAPQSRLIEATSLLRGHCRAVFARAPGLMANVEQWRGAQLSGISLDLEDAVSSDGRLDAGELNRFAARAQGVAPRLVAYSINDRPTMLAAWGAGFTHLSGELIFDRLKEPLTPVRFEPSDLYGEQKIG